MLLKFYLASSILALGAYGLNAIGGQELSFGGRGFVPKNVRQNPRGYRTFHYWHSGYRGGK